MTNYFDNFLNMKNTHFDFVNFDDGGNENNIAETEQNELKKKEKSLNEFESFCQLFYSQYFNSPRDEDCDISEEDLYYIKNERFEEESKSKNIEKNKKFNVYPILTKKKRGRLRKEEVFSGKEGREKHGKSEKDNILIKIQVHFMSFIVKFINYYIEKYLKDKRYLFYELSYTIKRDISRKFFTEIKSKTLGEVLRNKPSKKSVKKKNWNKSYEKMNEEVFKHVYGKNKVLTSWLDYNYLDFFHNIYCNDNWENKEINFPRLKDLIIKEKKNNPNELDYIPKITNTVKLEFMKPEAIFYITKREKHLK